MTSRFILSGFGFALLLNLFFYAYALEKDWGWAGSFLFIWMNNALAMFMTFFHEIGHTLAGWFYGVPTIPMFDFAHGGGWAWHVTDQKLGLLFCVWAGLAYVWYRAEGYSLIRWGIASLILFNIATAFNDGHLAVISFMGPAFEVLCGGFFLFRALFDLAPRGSGERFLNALLGFAFPLHSLIDGYSLLNIASARERYYTQKDGQGAGDFDQIANRLDFVSFDGVVIFWMLLAVLSLIVPAILYAIYRGGEADEDISAAPSRRI